MYSQVERLEFVQSRPCARRAAIVSIRAKQDFIKIDHDKLT